MAATQRQIASRRATADALSARLSALDPRGVLKRGYAIVSRSTKAGDQVVASAQDVPAGSLLSLLFADGSVAARALGASSEDGGDQLELKF
jgi:exonuclease VII large subunit